MMEMVMHILHHGNHEPALAARVEKTHVGHIETKMKTGSVMKVGFIPWQHQCEPVRWPPPERAVVSRSPEDAAKQSSFLASIPSVRQSHLQQVDPRTPGMAPSTAWVDSDLTNRAISKLENYESSTFLY
jgi:hypothetical protein